MYKSRRFALHLQQLLIDDEMATTIMETILLGLLCLAAFSEAMPQSKPLRKIHIQGRPIEGREINRDRTSIPNAPALEEESKLEGFKALNVAPVVAHRRTSDEEAELFRKQAEGAHYSFDSSIDDGINGQSHSRTETRDGLNVQGMYSYNDGYYKRTVYYEADDKGYRIVKEENEPVGDGPVYDKNGEAYVKSSLGSEYTITVDDIQKVPEKINVRVADS
ncbi:uncharacterized protein LOC143921598 [Arctopsyche grandis]|uniref:uncharacterized protein LOC143921598 n=1 Tax=Arctopsyche grandis TaxID=121162 RepID=UPI00406D6D16